MRATGRKRVIIYGGTFDPPHRGHLMMLRAAAAQFRPSALYALPALRSPLKAEPSENFRARERMLRASLSGAGLPVRVSRFERRKNRVTYTWEALEYFRKKHPEAELYFLLGSDCLPGFRRWRRPGRILSSARLLVGRRRGFAAAGRPPKGTVFLRGLFPEEASTAIRRELYCGGLPGAVPAAAARIIREKGLYLGRLRDRVVSRLGRRRARHTLSCARLACELASVHGLDARSAATAALIHDYAKELPRERLVRTCRSARLRVPFLRATVLNSPGLLHGWVSAFLARRELGVGDPAALRAAERHTIGHPRMSPEDMLLFVADMAAWDRDFPGVAKLRALAFRDLRAAAAAAARLKMDRLRGKGKWIHPLGLRTCLALNS